MLQLVLCYKIEDVTMHNIYRAFCVLEMSKRRFTTLQPNHRCDELQYKLRCYMMKTQRYFLRNAKVKYETLKNPTDDVYSETKFPVFEKLK